MNRHISHDLQLLYSFARAYAKTLPFDESEKVYGIIMQSYDKLEKTIKESKKD